MVSFFVRNLHAGFLLGICLTILGQQNGSHAGFVLFILASESIIARLACSTNSVCVIFFGFTRPAGKVLPGAVDIVLMTVQNRPAGPVLTGAVDIDLMTVPKLSKNVPKNVQIT